MLSLSRARGSGRCRRPVARHRLAGTISLRSSPDGTADQIPVIAETTVNPSLWLLSIVAEAIRLIFKGTTDWPSRLPHTQGDFDCLLLGQLAECILAEPQQKTRRIAGRDSAYRPVSGLSSASSPSGDVCIASVLAATLLSWSASSPSRVGSTKWMAPSGLIPTLLVCLRWRRKTEKGGERHFRRSD